MPYPEKHSFPGKLKRASAQLFNSGLAACAYLRSSILCYFKTNRGVSRCIPNRKELLTNVPQQHVCMPVSALTCKPHANFEQAVSSDAAIARLTGTVASPPTVQHRPCEVVIVCMYNMTVTAATCLNSC
jgi:hypothetical protein